MPRFCFFLLIVLLPGCKDEPVPPEIIKDPRTYSWSVDTLAYPGSFQTSMMDIWGSSPTDVYVVGHNDRGYGKMFHFDGTNWKDVVLYFPDEHGVASIDLSAIYGFSKNDIWAVGERIHDNPTPPPNFLDSSLVLHYDGVSWKEHRLYGGRKIQSIWGSSSSDLWVGGVDGTLFHYNGTGWKRDSVRLSYPKDGTFQIKSISDRYMICNRYDIPSGLFTKYFLHYTNSSWVPLDSCGIHTPNPEDKWGAAKLWSSDEGVLYSAGLKGVYRYINNVWQQSLVSLHPLYSVSGKNDNNIVATGIDGLLYHFNGSDWYQYTQLENTDVTFTAVWIFEKEIFVVGNVISSNFATTTVILRGK